MNIGQAIHKDDAYFKIEIKNNKLHVINEDMNIDHSHDISDIKIKNIRKITSDHEILVY